MTKRFRVNVGSLSDLPELLPELQAIPTTPVEKGRLTIMYIRPGLPETHVDRSAVNGIFEVPDPPSDAISWFFRFQIGTEVQIPGSPNLTSYSCLYRSPVRLINDLPATTEVKVFKVESSVQTAMAFELISLGVIEREWRKVKEQKNGDTTYTLDDHSLESKDGRISLRARVKGGAIPVRMRISFGLDEYEGAASADLSKRGHSMFRLTDFKTVLVACRAPTEVEVSIRDEIRDIVWDTFYDKLSTALSADLLPPGTTVQGLLEVVIPTLTSVRLGNFDIRFGIALGFETARLASLFL